MPPDALSAFKEWPSEPHAYVAKRCIVISRIASRPQAFIPGLGWGSGFVKSLYIQAFVVTPISPLGRMTGGGA
jgi:hypothetical protein